MLIQVILATLHHFYNTAADTLVACCFAVKDDLSAETFSKVVLRRVSKSFYTREAQIGTESAA